MAAPSKLNQKLIDDLCHYISRGVAIKYATDAIGISTECYHRWLKEGFNEKKDNEGNENYTPSIKVLFYDAITKVKANFIMEAIENIKKAGATRKNWAANTWLLERLYQSGYSKDGIEVQQLARDIDEIKRILFGDIDPANQHHKASEQSEDNQDAD